jgi:hypothetical protein
MKPTPASTNPAAAANATPTARGRALSSSQERVARNGASAVAADQMNAVNSPLATINAPKRIPIMSGASQGVSAPLSVDQSEATHQGR